MFSCVLGNWDLIDMVGGLINEVVAKNQPNKQSDCCIRVIASLCMLDCCVISRSGMGQSTLVLALQCSFVYLYLYSISNISLAEHFSKLVKEICDLLSKNQLFSQNSGLLLKHIETGTRKKLEFSTTIAHR